MGLLIQINPESNTPLFRQIMDQMVDLIDKRVLAPGVRLPSSRELADRLEVNRSTVYKAYQELWALGYLESRPGSYSTVRQRPQLVPVKTGGDQNLIDWQQVSRSGARELYDLYMWETSIVGSACPAGTIDFVPLSPDHRLFPIDDFRKCMNHALVNEGSEVLQYGSAQGYEPLRHFIAARMSQHGVNVSADEILITTGAQNAIDMLFQLLVEPGRAVGFEAPTYSKALDIFRLHQVNRVEIPMNDQGMDLAALERSLSNDQLSLIYTIPNFHNPTGITTDQAHREKLLGLCEKYRVPLVEDGFEEEMKYFGKAVLPIKSMDRRGVVIYLGTFSKVLFPGLRIGWVAASKGCIERLLPIQKTTILCGNILDQAALEYYCRQGYYDLHIKRMHRIYRKRMQTAFKALKEYLPADLVSWTQPAGGYSIWINVRKTDLDEVALAAGLTDHGVRVLPGRFYYQQSPDGPNYRLSIAHLDEDEIREGIRRLAEALASLT